MTYALFLQLEGDDDSSHIADRIVRVAHLDDADAPAWPTSERAISRTIRRASGLDPQGTS